MIYLLWLSGPVALMIWMYGHRVHRAHRADDLGMVSERWLHDYRCETHEHG